MSSRIVRGDARSAASPTPWAIARPATLAPQRVESQAPGNDEAEREMEVRVRHARESGRQEGRTEAERAAQNRVREVEGQFARAVADLASHRARLRREAEHDVVMLAIGVASRVLRRQVATDPEALHGLVKAALDRLEAREITRVRIHDAQAPGLEDLLRRVGVPQRVEVVADPGLEPGGVIFETSRGHLDASVSTQLDEIGRGLADLAGRRSV
jgi:flagellar assembly protein FliH